MIEIEININSSTPVYRQIIEQIYEAVQSGLIKDGFILPPIRQLANDLVINHNTVAKAYKILEDNNIIKTAGRRGTFIKRNAKRNLLENLNQMAIRKLNDLIDDLTSLGISESELKKIFNQLIKK